MASEAQIAANRANAARSTGPRTVEGKARVALNGLKHGMLSVSLLPGESNAEFLAFHQTYLDLCQPANAIQSFLVARMVLAAWRLNRLASLEARIVSAHHSTAIGNANLTHSLRALLRSNQPADPDGEPESEPESPAIPPDPVADAYIRDGERGDSISKLARYQTSLERSYYRALHDLERRLSNPESSGHV